jgi:outer membrane protein assembly factor BamB
VLLTAPSGKERAYHRGLNDVFFGKDASLAVFDAAEVKLWNRATKAVHVLPKATGTILRVAFTTAAAVLSWVGGPVTSYDLESGELLWTYKPEGTRAYALAPASDSASVWVAEQPGYKDPPWHRVRQLSPAGEVNQEVRCALGHSFEIAPYSDSVIRGNLLVTPIGALGEVT